MSVSVAILGSGNMAFHLLRAFDKSGIRLEGLVSRDLNKGMKTLEATGAKCDLIDSLDLSNVEADVIMLAIPDGAILKVQSTYHFNSEHIIVHTSGAEPMDSLHWERTGVFYPLQTLTWGHSVDLSKVPILIEGTNLIVEQKLVELGNYVSNEVKVISSKKRLRVHLAAVLASNFSNHLLSRAQEILMKEELSLDLLYPLMEQTISKSKSAGPKRAQTGPALRGDQGTMQKHLELIEDEDLKKIYELLSKDIIRTHGPI